MKAVAAWCSGVSTAYGIRSGIGVLELTAESALATASVLAESEKPATQGPPIAHTGSNVEAQESQVPRNLFGDDEPLPITSTEAELQENF